jgi:hypothetical protein
MRTSLAAVGIAVVLAILTPSVATGESGPPSGPCVDGSYKVLAPGKTRVFFLCDHGQWVEMECGPGTVANYTAGHKFICD